MIPDFTLVVGVDEHHLRQLAYTWPTWKQHKPKSLGLDGSRPMLVFYDHKQVTEQQVRIVVKHPNLTMQPWPPASVVYPSGDGDKWTNPQRYKMLAGFVYVPATEVGTDYWLKLDTDVVATGDDDWIDPDWFLDSPAIVAHPWSFTRPADQMQRFDAWAGKHDKYLCLPSEPLNLVPQQGNQRIGHKRIISWCGFFERRFSLLCAVAARDTCGLGFLPQPTQDGFAWYLAKRMGLPIVRTSMKKRGWQQWSGMKNVVRHAEEAMKQ